MRNTAKSAHDDSVIEYGYCGYCFLCVSLLQLAGPRLGMAVNVDIRKMTANSLYDDIRTLLTDNKYICAFVILCKGLRVQPPLSSKFACKKSLINSIRASLSICIGFRPFVPEELDMNLTS